MIGLLFALTLVTSAEAGQCVVFGDVGKRIVERCEAAARWTNVRAVVVRDYEPELVGVLVHQDHGPAGNNELMGRFCDQGWEQVDVQELDIGPNDRDLLATRLTGPGSGCENIRALAEAKAGAALAEARLKMFYHCEAIEKQGYALPASCDEVMVPKAAVTNGPWWNFWD
jgi:hypothetical protein